MVVVDMEIARSMDEVTNLQIAYLGNHMYEQSIGSDIEGEPEETVHRSLIELAGEAVIRYVELEEAVAWGERHAVSLSWIVGDDEISAAIRILFAGIDDFLYLVDALPVEISPLIAIHRSEIAPCFRESGIVFDVFDKNLELLVPLRSVFRIFLRQAVFLEIILEGPFVPDADIVIDEVFDVRITGEEPEEFMDDAFREDFFRGEKGKSFGEIAAELIAENAPGARTGAVVAVDAFVHDVLEEFEVLLHRINERKYALLLYRKSPYPPFILMLIFCNGCIFSQCLAKPL